MPAQLFPTVRGLQLVVSTPVDISTGLIRDDLVGIKVWYNTTIPDFNPETQGTLAYNGDGLNVLIPDLSPGVTYYIKYALISFLDETVYDDSTSLSAIPLSGVTVDVRNSNPVTVVPADAGGTVLSFEGTGTVLKVYEGSTELNYDGLGLTAGTWKVETSFTNITVPGNYITDSGTFVTTSNISTLTQDKGTVSFTITGRSVSDEFFSVVTTQTISKSRSSAAPLVDINGLARFNASYDGASYTPSSFLLTAVIANIDNPTYLWSVTGATTSTPLTNNTLTVTPTSDLIEVSLTVNGTNLVSPITRTVQSAASYDGNPGPSIDISGITGFNKNSGGVIFPATSTLTAVTAYVSNPTYSWSVTNATLNASNTQSVILTPSGDSPITVTLTVNGSNLASPLQKEIKMTITQDGAQGVAGANGTMSAFPTIYQWTASSTPPARPTTTSTYTWATGSYTAPSGWFTTSPSNTSKGYYLWEITVPLVVSATTTTSTVDWTNTSFPIRATAYNGADGNDGNDGANALLAVLTNETHAVPTDNLGNNAIFTNSGTDIYVYEGSNLLTYDGSGTAAGTWTVSKVATNVTSPAAIDSGNYATIPAITAMSADVGNIAYTITGKTLAGASFTLYKTQRFSKVKAGVNGADVIINQIVTSSPVLVKDASDSSTTGTYTSITVQGIRYQGTSATPYGWVTITANGDTEAGTATNTASSPVTLAPASNAGKSSYTIRLYNQATVSGATLLDTRVVNVVFKGSSVISVNLTNDVHNIPTDSNGNNAVLTNSGTDIYLYEGGNVLTYDGVGSSNGTWTISTKTDINVISGSITDQGVFARLGNITAISSDTAEVRLTITGKTLGGAVFSVEKAQRLVKARGGVNGTSPIVYEIVTSSPVIVKDAPDAATDGVHSSITIQGKQYNGNVTSNYGWITVTANGSVEATTATNTASSPITLAPGNADDKTFYTIKMYNQATVSGATLLDTKVVYIVFKGSTGSPGATGASGSATYVITRVANDDSAPTNAEVTALIGRNPVAGDIATVSYNNANGAKVYRYTTMWVLFSSYITGSLIVQNTITAANMATGTITAESGVIGSINADTITAGTITGRTYQTNTDPVSTATKKIIINRYDSVAASETNQIEFYGKLDIAATTFGNLATIGMMPVAGAVDAVAVFGSIDSEFTGVAARTKRWCFYARADSSSNTNGVGYVALNTYYGMRLYGTNSGIRMDSNGLMATGMEIYSPSGNGVYVGSAGSKGGYFTSSQRGVEGAGSSFDFYASGSGTNYGPFTGGHDGLIRKSDQIEVGDILVDETLIHAKGISNTIFLNKLSNSINQKSVIGVLVSRQNMTINNAPACLITKASETSEGLPEVIENYDNLCQSYDLISFNALGEGQINVCKDGGNIEAGDYITTSNRPGKGMKQSDDIYRNYTVARARESVSWDEDDDSIKQIACIYLCG